LEGTKIRFGNGLCTLKLDISSTRESRTTSKPIFGRKSPSSTTDQLFAKKKKKKKKKIDCIGKKRKGSNRSRPRWKNSRRNSRAEVEKGQLEKILKDTGSDDNTTEEDNAEDAVGIRLLRRVALLLPYQSSTSPADISTNSYQNCVNLRRMCKQV
jgi:hypothetical protein